MGAEENHGAGLEHTDTLGKHTDLQLGSTHPKLTTTLGSPRAELGDDNHGDQNIGDQNILTRLREVGRDVGD